MNIVWQTLLEVFNDPHYELLHKDTKQNIKLAVNRCEFLNNLIASQILEKQSGRNASAQAHGQWLGQEESRWLVRESDLYDQKTGWGPNTNDPTYPGRSHNRRSGDRAD